MVMTLDIPDTIVQQAEASGLSVEAYLQQTYSIEHPRESMSGSIQIAGHTSTAESRAQAVASIREIASRNTLGGLSIKDLINEGRKY